jgi:hypothetical protein
MIKDLIETHKIYPDSIVSNSIQKITQDNDKVLLYSSILRRANSFKKYRLNNNFNFFGMGFSGVLYKSSFFNETVYKSELFLSFCPNADDIWF